jgi:hypothetical protein
MKEIFQKLIFTLSVLISYLKCQFVPFSKIALTYDMKEQYSMYGMRFKSISPDKYIVLIPNSKLELNFYELKNGKFKEISRYLGRV